ncbi:unnamed protein product, partial [Iphiclides podalirius]
MYIKCFLVLFIVGYIEADYRLSSQSCGYPRLQNGKVRVRQRSRLVKFICQQQFELVGNKYATCRGSDWDVPLPVCVRSGCTVPQIENGITMPTRNNAWVVFFCLPNHRMIGGSTIYCDGRKWNGTAPTCVDSKSSSPLKCDFEEPNLCGWVQDDLHDFDWKRLNRKTPSSFLFTGPSFDHTYGQGGSGYYMYIESTSRLQNDTARLISPLYDRSLAKSGCFVFYYHMFGKTTGGLRVYQKPEIFSLDSLLKLSNKEKYILFEKWGNQGDVWYEAVLPLNDVYDNFQIVIEGIRGSSYTSDIAIDDVAILQGSNCTAAQKSTTTAKTPTSCVGRCPESLFDEPEVEGGCGCTINCIAHDNCCPDIFDVCMFPGTETSDDSANGSTEIAPQTMRLVATTPETTSTTTSMATTTTSATTTTTTTTTTAKPPTTKSTPRTTTTKPTTRATTTVATAVKKKYPPTSTSTTLRPRNSTLPHPTQHTTVRKSVNGTQKPTTHTSPPLTKTTHPTTTPTTPLTTSTTTKVAIDYSRPIEDHDAYKDMVEKAGKYGDDGENETVPEKHKNGSSGVKIWLIVLGVMVCCGGLAWLAIEAGSSRGRLTLARFRGQVARDPEVRYLSTDVDED